MDTSTSTQDQHKVALVTGGSRGIGRGITTALAAEGLTVVVNYRQARGAAEQVVKEVGENGAIACSFRADVSDAEQVDRLIAFVIGEYGRLNILVNNAGALVQPASWREFSTASWLATFDINLKSTVLCAQTAAEHLLRARGSIVNIASTFGPVLPAAGALPYGAAKAGVVAVTRSLAKELAPTVRVNCVAPGIVASDMTESAPADFVEQHRKETPQIGRAH